MKELTRRRFLRNGAALTTASLLKPGFSKAQSPTSKSGERPNILIFKPDQQQGATVLPEHPCLTPLGPSVELYISHVESGLHSPQLASQPNQPLTAGLSHSASPYRNAKA